MKRLFIIRELAGNSEVFRMYARNVTAVLKQIKKRVKAGKLLHPAFAVEMAGGKTLVAVHEPMAL